MPSILLGPDPRSIQPQGEVPGPASIPDPALSIPGGGVRYVPSDHGVTLSRRHESGEGPSPLDRLKAFFSSDASLEKGGGASMRKVLTNLSSEEPDSRLVVEWLLDCARQSKTGSPGTGGGQDFAAQKNSVMRQWQPLVAGLSVDEVRKILVQLEGRVGDYITQVAGEESRRALNEASGDTLGGLLKYMKQGLRAALYAKADEFNVRVTSY